MFVTIIIMLDLFVSFQNIMPTLWWWGAVVALMVSLPLFNADELMEVEAQQLSRG